jgi:muconolactone delta-isomerase
LKILALEQENPDITPDQFQVHAKAEATKVWELYQSGKIREIYFRQDTNCAVLVLECRNLEEAEQVLASLPFTQQGLITFDIIPLKPYPGFSRLFT